MNTLSTDLRAVTSVLAPLRLSPARKAELVNVIETLAGHLEAVQRHEPHHRAVASDVEVALACTLDALDVPTTRIAQRLGRSRSTVRDWVHGYSRGG